MIRRVSLLLWLLVATLGFTACIRTTEQPVSAPTIQPTATLAPLTPAFLPTSTLPVPTPHAQPERMATFFFYWYHCPERACDASELTAIPPGWLTPLPDDPDPRDGLAYSSINYDWFESELRDLVDVGFDLILPVSWGDHPHPWFRQDRLDLLVQANGILEEPLAIGMFLDTTAQQAMYNDFVADGYRFGPTIPRMPLSDARSGYFFYELHIKGFFVRIPREMWATEQGRPIIVTYTALCCDELYLAGELWHAVKEAFRADFGVEPWLILEETWFTPEALAPGEGLQPLEAVVDGRYHWGTALHGPQTATLRNFSVTSVGPGFDNRRIVGITDPRFQPREEPPGGGPRSNGAFFRASLAAVPPETDLLLIETWNEWPESTGIARASHQGLDGQPLPDDFYMDLLRRWRRGG